jgi:hypothetical protein
MVAGLKKKLVAVAAAVGQPRQGRRELLPTESYTQRPSGKYNWVAPFDPRWRWRRGKAKKSQQQIKGV